MRRDSHLKSLSIGAHLPKVKTQCALRLSSVSATQKLAAEKSNYCARFVFVPIRRRSGNTPLHVRIVRVELKMNKLFKNFGMPFFRDIWHVSFSLMLKGAKA